jgi:hypothetical protein
MCLSSAIGQGMITFVSQPRSATVSIGNQVTLFVIPTRFVLPTDGSLEPFNYQWFKNGTIPVGISTNRLEFANVQLGDSGSYHVVVSDALGAATSTAATLTVAIPPFFTSALSGTNVVAPGSLRLTAPASGTEPLEYRWRRDGVELPGQTNNSLNITNPTRLSSGEYSVVVSNISGSITSGVAPVRVIVPQRIRPLQLPFDGKVRIQFSDADGSVSFETNRMNFEVQVGLIPFTTNWVGVAGDVIFTNGIFQFDDLISSVTNRRFYRVIER